MVPPGAVLSIVVTGAGGYVGGRLIQHLRSTGVDVVPVVRTPKPWLPDGVVADLLGDPDALTARFADADAVVHLAGASEVRFGDDASAGDAYAETVTTTFEVAGAARRAGVARFVFLSTFHVYGGRTDDGVVHEGVEAAPTHPYARSRRYGEELAAECGPDHVVTLRLTNSIGPPVHADVDRWTLVANAFCRQVVAGEDLRPQDGGRALRDFVDLGEACRVIGEAAAGAVPRGTYNLGSGATTSILELAQDVAGAAEEVLGRRPAIEPQPAVGDPPPPFRVSIEKLAAHVAPPDPDLHRALVGTLRLLSRTESGDAQP
ncbi:MAG TPA: NAD(P)-dependent oxidoreductase [Iamia sp.]